MMTTPWICYSVVEYALHPPSGHIPRYCVYGVVSDLDNKEPVDSIATIQSHQDVVFCKGALYKYFDICKKGGCCPTNVMTCINFDIPFSVDIPASSRVNRAERGLRILLKYKPEEIIKTGKVLKRVPRITYLNHPATILLKIRQMENQSFNLNECVHGLIVYLQYTIFKLFPEHIEYRHVTDERYTLIVFIPFREGAKLDESNVNRLIGLKQKITFEKKLEGVVATADLRVLESNETIMSVFGNLRKDIKSESILQGYVKPITSKTHPPCSNVSLIISKTGIRSVVDAKCLDKSPVVSGANVNQETVKLGPLMIVVVSIFQYLIFMN